MPVTLVPHRRGRDDPRNEGEGVAPKQAVALTLRHGRRQAPGLRPGNRASFAPERPQRHPVHIVEEDRAAIPRARGFAAMIQGRGICEDQCSGFPGTGDDISIGVEIAQGRLQLELCGKLGDGVRRAA
jgi:hypothetical protein